MYRKLTTLFTTLVCGAAFAASPRVSLTVDTNGLLLAPTNFFQANAARIADMVSAASGVANTNSIWPAAGSNVSASTNGNIVTISADVSTASVTAAVQAGTNTLNSSLTTRITNATNDLNTALSSRILGATNALGSAAYQSSSAFDSAGAATAATNGITSPFLVSKLGFQPATNGVAQTNFPYTAITNSPWLQSANPTFTGTLTGPAVTVQSVSSVATLRLAGDSGTGGATRDIQSTPSGIVFENFQFANGTINGNISSTELDFLDGLTANIQAQLDALASTNGGSATNVFFADTATISHSTAGTSNTFSVVSVPSGISNAWQAVTTAATNALAAVTQPLDSALTALANYNFLNNSSDELVIELDAETLTHSDGVARLSWGVSQLIGDWSSDGTFTAAGFSGDGHSLTNLDVGSISNIVSSSNFPALYLGSVPTLTSSTNLVLSMLPTEPNTNVFPLMKLATNVCVTVTNRPTNRYMEKMLTFQATNGPVSISISSNTIPVTRTGMTTNGAYWSYSVTNYGWMTIWSIGGGDTNTSFVFRGN